jgi:hypothetical protein
MFFNNKLSLDKSESNSFKMLIQIFFSILLFLTVSADVHDMNGYYNMRIPGNPNQYVFNIDWSHTFNQYFVVVIGQELAWATARLTFINNTAITLVCDNSDILTGIVSYPTDLPSICWPTFQDFPCWNRLLSNISRIHVINM